MPGALTLFPGASLALIKSSATSVRLHTSPPASYSAAAASALGIASFLAGSLFTLSGSTLSAGQISGSVLAAGVAAFLSISNDTGSQLLATGPLPFVSTIAANESNWLLTSMSLATSTNIGAPTLTSP